MRLMEQTGDPTSTSGLDDWKEATRYGSQTSRGPSMPRTERKGSQTGMNITRSTVRPGDMTSNEKKTSATGEEQTTAAEESDHGPGEAEIRRGLPMLEIEQEGSQADKATTRLTTQLGSTTKSTTQLGDTTRPTQLGGTTRSTTQLGDTTRLTKQIGGQASSSSRDVVNEVTRSGSQIIRDHFLLHSEREGSQTGANTTKTSVQPGDMTRPTTRIGGITKLKEQIGFPACIGGLINGKEETRPEGRGERKSRRLVTKKPGGENDVRDNTSGEVIEDINIDRVVWNADDEEESPKALGEDRNKTMTATWDIVELDVSTTFLQGETIDRGVFVILLKVLVLGNKEIVKLGYLRSKYDHGTHDREGEEMLKDDEQSHFRKLAMNIWPELCLDAMESARDFEKARFKNIKKAGRILRKAKISNPGDYNEAISRVYEGGNYGKLTKANRYEEKLVVLVGECGGIYPISWKNEQFPRPTRFALAAEAQAATSIMGEEMSSIVEGTIGLELATENKGSQEAYQVDNQPKDKRAAVKTAALKRSFDMNIHYQETSQWGHPQLWVEAKKISDSRPSNDARSLPKQVKTGLNVRTGQQGVPDSVHQ